MPLVRPAGGARLCGLRPPRAGLAKGGGEVRNLKRISVLWLSTCQERPVGLVKAFDPAAGSWTYYAGIGRGWDEAADVREILAWGQKYEDLSVLQAFLAETEPPASGAWYEDVYGYPQCPHCGYEWDSPAPPGRFCPHCGMRLGPLRAGDGKEECP